MISRLVQSLVIHLGSLSELVALNMLINDQISVKFNFNHIEYHRVWPSIKRSQIAILTNDSKQHYFQNSILSELDLMVWSFDKSNLMDPLGELW